MSTKEELKARITPRSVGVESCQRCLKDVRLSYVYPVGPLYICLACFRSRGAWVLKD